MSWRFVHRTEPLEAIGRILRAERPGPLIIVGEPGIGRTSILTRSLELIDRSRDRPIVVTVAGGQRPPVSPTIPSVDLITVAASVDDIRRVATVRDEHDPRRLVFIMDDAHVADYDVMHLLRDLHRRYGAVLLLSCPAGTIARKPDPLDCLQYESDSRVLSVPPLNPEQVRSIAEGAANGPVSEVTVAALAAATGGNPGLLHDIMLTGGLASSMVRRDGQWRVPRVSGPDSAVTERSRLRLLRSVEDAWAAMSWDHLDELCRLALWAGVTNEAAPILAFVLLLRGRAREGIALLNSLEPLRTEPRPSTEVIMIRAMLLAFGEGNIERAVGLLAESAGPAVVPDQRLLAALAWICASVGRVERASEILRDLSPATGPEASVFAWAAAAVVELHADRPRAAVPLLRRAIISARVVRTELPWLPPYLTGVLIDALLLAGRINEATIAATDFHAAHEGCGWDVAVLLDTLIRSARVPTEG